MESVVSKDPVDPVAIGVVDTEKPAADVDEGTAAETNKQKSINNTDQDNIRTATEPDAMQNAAEPPPTPNTSTVPAVATAPTAGVSAAVPVPVTSLRRSAAVRRPPTRPGAVSMPGVNGTRDTAMDNIQEEPRGDGALAVARPVDLEDARPMDINHNSHDGQDNVRRHHQQKLMGYGIFGVLGMLCIVAIVVVFAVVAPKQRQQQQSHVDSTKEDAPFLSVDAMSPRDKLLAMLPESTIPSAQFGDTPQGKALEWVVQDANFASYSDQRLQQRFALATFWHATNGEQWGPNWLDTAQHECNWEYFMPENDEQYRQLVKRYAQYKYIESPCKPVDPSIVEEFPLTDVVVEAKNATFVSATAVLEQDEYMYLAMKGQELGGEIPPEITMLTSLKMIQLDQTSLQGSIPTILAALTTLEELHLYKSDLSGTIPSVLARLTELRALIIAGHKREKDIYGTLPSEFGLLRNLRTLNIFETSVTGTIPLEYTSNLRPYEMQLYDNELTGSVPSQIGLLTNLDWLGLELNHFNSTLPTELGNLQNLWIFYIMDNEMTGTIPTELGKFMGNIEQLYLNINRLTGSIPTELFPPDNAVWRLRLDANLLTGSIPSELGLLTQCSSLTLPNNTLTGPIPNEVAAIPSLQFFLGFDNQLTGPLPVEFFDNANMLYFWVENNRLSSTLPTEIGRWSNLLWLRLQNNTFSGPLPSELGLLQGLQTMLIDSNDWTGVVPNEWSLLATNGSLTTWNMTNNQGLSGELPDVFCDWQWEPDHVLAFDCGPVCGCQCSCDTEGNTSSKFV